MSYWIYLQRRVVTRTDRADGTGQWDESEGWESVPVEHFTDGGTYPIGGTDRAELNVTYNYGEHIWKYLDGGLRAIHGKRAGDFIETLERAVAELGTERDHDYWAATPGNAGHALNIMLAWSKQYPDAIWSVS
jgi:hypothetical protein